MKYKKTILYTVGLLSFFATKTIAQIKLSPIFSSNMVLQRNTEVNIWGWASSNETVTIKTSWLNKAISTQADKSGIWKIKIKTIDDRNPQSIIISNKSEKKVLENVLFGEVWLCAGQSNMEMPLKGFQGQPVFGLLDAQLRAHKFKIRQFKILTHGTKEPLDTPAYSKPWVEANAQTILDYGAVPYFFAKQLHEFLDVPIGIIQTPRGGSSVQTWMSKECIEQFQKVDLDTIQVNQTNNNKIPTVLFNAMLHPVIPFTIKGAIWYQGENNRLQPLDYVNLLPAMVKDWRNRWGQGDFPFYFVQIAPFDIGGPTSHSNFSNAAFIREAQLKCASIIPNSGIVITLDIGDKKTIHPPKKKEVGDRLAYHALNKTYEQKSLDCESPTFKSMEPKEGGLVLKFNNAETGLYTPTELEGFEVAGEEKIFYPAKATITNWREVFVESKMVTKPVAVRYAWSSWVQGTLFDTNLLPASSFRTDNWSDAKKAIEQTKQPQE
jgi:sialate O-acetylesterase